MDDKPAVSPEQLERLLAEFDRLRARHGPAALDRVEEALFGEPPEPAGDGSERPTFRVPGLTARPWHDPARFPACHALEAGAEAIRGELLDTLGRREGFQAYRQDCDFFVPKDHWKTMYFLVGGNRVEENRRLCPRTAAILDAIDETFGMVMFSALLPGGHIAPHRGPSNCRITIHLGLVVPPDCSLRVGEETRGWEAGRCLAFDDTFEHEAYNRSGEARFVLFADVWHPELSEAEIAALTAMQRLFAKGSNPQSLGRVLADREAERGHAWWA